MGLSELIERALDEDVGFGDVTTESCIPGSATGLATIRAKQPLVVCGQEAARRVFEGVAARFGGSVSVTTLVEDGAHVTNDTKITRLEGSLRSILIGERLALNIMMKLSGIATNVHEWVAASGPDGPSIVDTRKTTPLLRNLEKYAVRCGGGKNHRMALFDGVMIKDNHIVSVGSIKKAVHRVRANAHHLLKIEVEVASIAEVQLALDAGADVLLLDNMNNTMLAEAVALARAVRPEVILEASGNMNPQRISELRGLDLDVISAGGLIHQATWVDLSLTVHERSDVQRLAE
jgi:nicotinate-nucleotide pyrophosphorylase (carboxylating)